MTTVLSPTVRASRLGTLKDLSLGFAAERFKTVVVEGAQTLGEKLTTYGSRSYF